MTLSHSGSRFDTAVICQSGRAKSRAITAHRSEATVCICFIERFYLQTLLTIATGQLETVCALKADNPRRSTAWYTNNDSLTFRALLPSLTELENAMVPVEDQVRAVETACKAFYAAHDQWASELASSVCE